MDNTIKIIKAADKARLIDNLTALLEMARRGTVLSVAFCTIGEHGAPGMGWTASDGQLFFLSGAANLLNQELCSSVMHPSKT